MVSSGEQLFPGEYAAAASSAMPALWNGELIVIGRSCTDTDRLPDIGRGQLFVPLHCQATVVPSLNSPSRSIPS